LPVESQSAMPQTELPAVHWALQQLPVPARPQICELHWSLAEQGAPAGSVIWPPPLVLEDPPCTVVPPQATAAATQTTPSQFRLATLHLRKRNDGNRERLPDFEALGTQ
jgi:hypothetical protein